MNTDNIQIMLNDTIYEALVYYKFTPGNNAIINKDPIDCEEGSPSEYEIESLAINHNDYFYDVSFIIENEKEYIIEQLEELHD